MISHKAINNCLPYSHAGTAYTTMSVTSASPGEHKVHLSLSPSQIYHGMLADKLLTAPQELGPPLKSVQATLTTSASIFLKPGNISGWRGLLQANSSYTFGKQRQKVSLTDVVQDYQCRFGKSL